ncbi:MAG: hypothetical protein JAY75_13810, partial [Candidatus Thiodiazotropha taylori]|nr:hypothetical protein [Candidatus Thiodiazotropha taylori]MCW4309293.1 hypothetical protein [Candidatus Thiodiazotropha endolucinida]
PYQFLLFFVVQKTSFGVVYNGGSPPGPCRLHGYAAYGGVFLGLRPVSVCSSLRCGTHLFT